MYMLLDPPTNSKLMFVFLSLVIILSVTIGVSVENVVTHSDYKSYIVGIIILAILLPMQFLWSKDIYYVIKFIIGFILCFLLFIILIVFVSGHELSTTQVLGAIFMASFISFILSSTYKLRYTFWE
jgi:hypothetical protein